MPGQYLPLATYSFMDVVAQILGPGLVSSLASGSANAEEGISIEFDEETGTMQKGADGSIVHSLHAVKSGRCRVRLLKTSPINSVLNSGYNYQRSSSLFWGKNILVLNNPTTGDNYSCQQVAFARGPSVTWAKESEMIEWEFNIGVIVSVLGSLNLAI